MQYILQCQKLTEAFVTHTDLLSAVVYPEDEQQCDEVENSKNVLAQMDVHPMVGDIVESCEDVHKASRVPATTGANYPLFLHGKLHGWRHIHH